MIEFILYGLCSLRHLDGQGCHSHLHGCGKSGASKPACLLASLKASIQSGSQTVNLSLVACERSVTILLEFPAVLALCNVSLYCFTVMKSL